MPSARPLVDHEEIRTWAESRNARPACVQGTGGRGDVGMIRLDFPGFTGAGTLQSVSWDEWFQRFDQSGLALIVQDTTADGARSNFNKLVSRDTVADQLEAVGEEEDDASEDVVDVEDEDAEDEDEEDEDDDEEDDEARTTRTRTKKKTRTVRKAPTWKRTATPSQSRRTRPSGSGVPRHPANARRPSPGVGA